MTHTAKALRTNRNLLIEVLKVLFQNRNFIIGFVIVVSIILCGMAPNLLQMPYPHFGDYASLLPMGSPGHLLGTDPLGRDLLSTFLWSIQSSIIIGFVAATGGTMIAVMIGFLAGLSRMLDHFLRSFNDVFMVIPVWPILIIVSMLVRSFDLVTLALILAVFSWPWAAKEIRSQVLSLKEREFVNVARVSGLNRLEILFREIFPNMIPYIAAGFVTSVTGAMLSEVSLEIIGLGPQNVTTLGLMIYWATSFNSLMKGWWWIIMPPVFLLIVFFIGLFLTSLGFDDISNPRLRK